MTYATADKSKAQANCRIIGMDMQNALSYQRYERMFLSAGAKNRRLLLNLHKSAYVLFFGSITSRPNNGEYIILSHN